MALKTQMAQLRAAKALVTIIRDPQKTGDVFKLADSLMNPKLAALMIARISRSEQGAQALKERPRLPKIDLEQLDRCPSGSLGKTYAAHMLGNRLSPTALPQRAGETPESYLLAHLYECHDIWHVVTGFDTSVEGEMGLQAFATVHGSAKAPLAIISAGMLNAMLFRIEERDARMRAVTQGWLLGRRAKPLFGVRWAEHFNEPLEDVRRRFALDPAGVERILQ